MASNQGSATDAEPSRGASVDAPRSSSGISSKSGTSSYSSGRRHGSRTQPTEPSWNPTVLAEAYMAPGVAAPQMPYVGPKGPFSPAYYAVMPHVAGSFPNMQPGRVDGYQKPGPGGGMRPQFFYAPPNSFVSAPPASNYVYVGGNGALGGYAMTPYAMPAVAYPPAVHRPGAGRPVSATTSGAPVKGTSEPQVILAPEPVAARQTAAMAGGVLEKNGGGSTSSARDDEASTLSTTASLGQVVASPPSTEAGVSDKSVSVKERSQKTGKRSTSPTTDSDDDSVGSGTPSSNSTSENSGNGGSNNDSNHDSSAMSLPTSSSTSNTPSSADSSSFVFTASGQGVLGPSARSPHKGPLFALWVGNLPEDVTTNEMQTIFEGHDYASIFVRPRYKCAFVNFVTEESAKQAIESVHGREYRGKNLVVRFRNDPAATAHLRTARMLAAYQAAANSNPAAGALPGVPYGMLPYMVGPPPLPVLSERGSKSAGPVLSNRDGASVGVAAAPSNSVNTSAGATPAASGVSGTELHLLGAYPYNGAAMGVPGRGAGAPMSLSAPPFYLSPYGQPYGAQPSADSYSVPQPYLVASPAPGISSTGGMLPTVAGVAAAAAATAGTTTGAGAGGLVQSPAPQGVYAQHLAAQSRTASTKHRQAPSPAPAVLGGSVTDRSRRSARTPTVSTPAASNASPASASRGRFFVLRAATVEDVQNAFANGLWTTSAQNLNPAFRANCIAHGACDLNGDTVNLIFAVHRDNTFFGYARMASEAVPVPNNNGARLPFDATRHLQNPANGNKEVKVGRDGQEVDPAVGTQLLSLFEAHASNEDSVSPMAAGMPPRMEVAYSDRPQPYTDLNAYGAGFGYPSLVHAYWPMAVAGTGMADPSGRRPVVAPMQAYLTANGLFVAPETAGYEAGYLPESAAPSSRNLPAMMSTLTLQASPMPAGSGTGVDN